MRPTPPTRSSSAISSYRAAVRAELAKKLGPGSVHDVRSLRFEEIVDMAFKSSVHTRACAGIVVIASGLAPDKMPSAALCCGQR